MSTKIEWTDETWNPVTGCTPISEGCQNCYARRMATRLRGRYGYPEVEPFQIVIHTDRLFFDMDGPQHPRRWRKPRKIFVCSMGDICHEEVPTSVIRRVMSECYFCPEHTFLWLTKRPRRLLRGFPAKLWPDNLWLGVTAENQPRLEERLPVLRRIPARLRFVSIEPMLEPMAFSREMLKGLDWVIVGGETGPGARPIDADSIRYLRDQCQEAGVPFFMKKMAGGKEPPEDLIVRQWPEIQHYG